MGRIRKVIGPFLMAFAFASCHSGCGGGGGGGGAPPAPQGGPDPGQTTLAVIGTVPGDGAQNVAVGSPIIVTFNRAVEPATVTTANFTLSSGGIPVTGNLAYDTIYVATVTTDVQDQEGNALSRPHTWTFRTSPPPLGPVLRGIVLLDNNATVTYDNTTKTVTLDLAAVTPLAGTEIEAIRPNPDNNAMLMSKSVATTAASGSFSFPSLETGLTLIVADKRLPSGVVRRVMGVARIYAPVQTFVQIRLCDVTPEAGLCRLEAFCLDCHPTRENVSRAGQIARCIHKSGFIPTDPIYTPVPLPAGKTDEFGWVMCESCHVVHDPTGYLHFTVANYQGALCQQCHM